MLRAGEKANPSQKIDELSNNLKNPQSTIQERLLKNRKINREGVWILQKQSEENKANQFITCNLLIQWNTEEFFDLSTFGDGKNGSSIKIQNAKSSGSLPPNESSRSTVK